MLLSEEGTHPQTSPLLVWPRTSPLRVTITMASMGYFTGLTQPTRALAHRLLAWHPGRGPRLPGAAWQAGQNGSLLSTLRRFYTRAPETKLRGWPVQAPPPLRRGLHEFARRAGLPHWLNSAAQNGPACLPAPEWLVATVLGKAGQFGARLHRSGEGSTIGGQTAPSWGRLNRSEETFIGFPSPTWKMHRSLQ